jgi:molybdenum cofactor synthesis domain-containing protein
MSKTAGIIIIGDEILSGKVQDGNAFFMAQELWAHGIQLSRISVIPDLIDEIAEEVKMFADKFDYVFTSGGIGPTHDDMTIEGISKAFNVRTVINETLRRILETRQGSLSAAQLRMAEVPEGAELVHDDTLSFPLIKFRNVFIFPGIPQLLRKKFLAVEKMFHEPLIHLKKVYVNESEAKIALILNDIVQRYQNVKIGSYPVLENPDYSVMITLESLDVSSLSSAYVSLLDNIPKDKLCKAEG